jgi:hypothetical protein
MISVNVTAVSVFALLNSKRHRISSSHPHPLILPICRSLPSSCRPLHNTYPIDTYVLCFTVYAESNCGLFPLLAPSVEANLETRAPLAVFAFPALSSEATNKGTFDGSLAKHRKNAQPDAARLLPQPSTFDGQLP